MNKVASVIESEGGTDDMFESGTGGDAETSGTGSAEMNVDVVAMNSSACGLNNSVDREQTCLPGDNKKLSIELESDVGSDDMSVVGSGGNGETSGTVSIKLCGGDRAVDVQEQLPANVDDATSIPDLFTNISSYHSSTMEYAIIKETSFIWKKSIRDFQLSAIMGFLDLDSARMGDSILQIPTYTAIAPTGGGKSLIFQVLGTLLGGISLVITPLLTLSVDHVGKFTNFPDNIGTIESFHIDNICKSDRILLMSHLLSFKPNQSRSIFLFISPQSLLASTVWTQFLIKLHRQQILLRVVFDEPQVLVSQGLSFRPNFLEMKSSFISPLLTTKCPNELHLLRPKFLIISATFTSYYQELFHKITGVPVKMSPERSIVSTKGTMDRRDVRIFFRYGSTVLGTMSDGIKRILALQDATQIIIFTNTRRECIKVKEGMDKLMTDIGLDYDTVLIHGLHDSDDKSMRAKLFTGKLESVHLNIKILAATVKCAGAGIDNLNVRQVYFQGIPDSPEDMAQALGRGGRHANSNPAEDHFVLVCSIESFNYMYIRAYDQDEDIAEHTILTKDEKISWAIKNIMLTMKLLFLNRGCLHVQLGKLFGSTTATAQEPCRNACDACFSKGTRALIYDSIFFPADRKEFSKHMIDLLSSVGMVTISVFVNSFICIADGHKRFYKKSKSSVLKSSYEITTLQLIACGILTCSLGKDEDNASITMLSIAYDSETLIPMCATDKSWEHIKTL